MSRYVFIYQFQKGNNTFIITLLCFILISFDSVKDRESVPTLSADFEK